ncbi:TPA: hypothetical protein NID32_004694 [Pseudomonas aeruginosa]|uniref:hypothetical protein n=1 Tax=Pseudomonas aeruginosa TaxID=287 RepID=UPI00068DE4F7|nr:hypothetical protein [Pseudomonas aeruginosa]HBO2143067.1 hypothetical protein [Pseudomonas aeruginosa]HBP0760875.1 hypothetical protein [Pseudomonas aeruginosa]HCE9578223.1 hypothetical protein [Pseudomonas aeruginosa]HCE9850262.1 hypothetical protein [Pseudomonas aeruginosa]HCF2862962.1 hypothetical protein [Pseudomonas aeruginosa]
MGLHVNSIADLPLSESRSYYLYVLDYYNWDEPISNTLRNSIERIELFCSRNNSVMIRGLPSSHFYSEVLSWVKINGQEPEAVLPAVLITTLHPQYFIDSDNSKPLREIFESLVFLKIREICKAPGDVVDLLEKIFKDIREDKKIKDFRVARELRKGERGALVDALILEPNFVGFGVDVKKVVGWIKDKMLSDV